MVDRRLFPYIRWIEASGVGSKDALAYRRAFQDDPCFQRSADVQDRFHLEYMLKKKVSSADLSRHNEN